MVLALAFLSDGNRLSKKIGQQSFQIPKTKAFAIHHTLRQSSLTIRD